MRDFQRKRVYTWEKKLHTWDVNNWDTEARMSLDDCKALALRALSMYDCSPVIEMKAVGGYRACANRNRITLSKFFHTKSGVIHEVAHVIIRRLHCDDSHGPMFMRCYIDLMVKFLGGDREDLESSAEKAGIEFQKNLVSIYGNVIHPNHTALSKVQAQRIVLKEQGIRTRMRRELEKRKLIALHEARGWRGKTLRAVKRLNLTVSYADKYEVTIDPPDGMMILETGVPAGGVIRSEDGLRQLVCSDWRDAAERLAGICREDVVPDPEILPPLPVAWKPTLKIHKPITITEAK